MLRWRRFAGAGFAAGLVVATVAWMAGSELPRNSGGGGASQPAIAEWPDPVVLIIEMTPGGFAAAVRPNSTFFVLYADGQAIYRDWRFGQSATEEKTAYLTQEQIRDLVAFAIGAGGMANAAELYEFVTFGPAGSTIITLNAPELTKTVTYQLPPGNLSRDPDPDLGLSLLIGRMSFFTRAVEQGMAAGGMLLADDQRARRIALRDPRVAAVRESSIQVDRVVPVPGHPRQAYVVVSVAGGLPSGLPAWSANSSCETGGAAGQATGIVWRVDLENERVVDLSPRWGELDCLGGI